LPAAGCFNFLQRSPRQPSKPKVLDDLSTINCKINTLQYISREAQATLIPLVAKGSLQAGGLLITPGKGLSGYRTADAIAEIIRLS
jgi:hypothetical protein